MTRAQMGWAAQQQTNDGGVSFKPTAGDGALVSGGVGLADKRQQELHIWQGITWGRPGYRIASVFSILSAMMRLKS